MLALYKKWKFTLRLYVQRLLIAKVNLTETANIGPFLHIMLCLLYHMIKKKAPEIQYRSEMPDLESIIIIEQIT